jgi:hypothetical protein
VQQGEDDEYKILMGKSLGRGHLKRLKGNGEIMLRRVRYEI